MKKITILFFLCVSYFLYEEDAITQEKNTAFIEFLFVPVLTDSGARLYVDLIIYSKMYKARWSKHLNRYITYCNIFARDILDNREYERYKEWFGCYINAYSYDVHVVFPTPDSVLSVKIKDAYIRAAYAKRRGWIRELTPYEAQEKANQGIVVWVISSKYNHEAIVCPSTLSYDFDRGPSVAQAGYYNGIFYVGDKEVFGRDFKSKEIKYYEFPLREK